ncbi:MAG: hypothetical protein ACPGVG_18915 [Mycobacterium sp.]
MTSFFQEPDFTNEWVEATQDEIRATPMLYRCDLNYSYRLGGRIVRAFIDRAARIIDPQDFQFASLDTRTHMLMPGFMPCIPGWHCDDFWRPDPKGRAGTFSDENAPEPDLHNVPRMRHLQATFGYPAFPVFLPADIAAQLPRPEHLDRRADETLYASYHQNIENFLGHVGGDLRHAGNGQLISFGPRVFHRGTVARTSGWRLFCRLTLSNHHQPVNEIRTQTQVYLPDPYRGW